DEAGVNRGLIHHYFGSRRALLRAAVDRGIRMSRETYEEHRRNAPEEKAEWNFGIFMEHPGFARLVVLLALDGDTSFGPIAFAHERVRDMEREKAEGALPRNTDPVGLITFWDSILLGYTVIREAAAAQFGIPVAELDGRVLATLMQPPGSA
ncbi:MAG: TetR/AcrR family transcriptional regulator, partial [Hyphomicrobiales bacterium]